MIGKDVPFALLQAIAELPEDTLRLGLTHLQAAEFLYETSLFPELEYTFKHALTHEVAYGGLLHERRRALHARIVEAMEQRYAERLAEQVEQLAHHALRGEVWEKVLLYCRQAGTKALARSANREAVAYFEQALGALTHLPDSRERREQAIDLRFDLRPALVPVGEMGQIFAYMREAELLAEALGDQRRLGRALIYMTRAFWEMGDQERALETGQRVFVSRQQSRRFQSPDHGALLPRPGPLRPGQLSSGSRVTQKERDLAARRSESRALRSDRPGLCFLQ